MNAHDTRKKSRGFSLLEVLLAMIIMSIGLFGVLALQAVSVRASAGGRGRETAVYLCEAFLDNVQAEAQRLGLTSGYSIPASSSATVKYLGLGTPASAGPPPTPAVPAVTSGTLYFDVNGTETTAAGAGRVFTLNWARQAPRDGAPNCFEFSATVTWSFETNASNAPVVKTVQINRLVRI